VLYFNFCDLTRSPYLVQEIDSYISRVSEQGYSALLNLGSKGLSFAANIVVSTAIKVGNACEYLEVFYLSGACTDH